MMFPSNVAVFPCSASANAFKIYLIFSCILGVMVVIFGVVLVALAIVLLDPSYRPTRLERGWLETWWIRIPIMIVITMAVPSIYGLICMKGSPWPLFTVFIMGHQWYWEYDVVLPVSHKSWYSVGGGSEEEHLGEELSELCLEYFAESYGVTEPEGIGEVRLCSSDAHLLLPAEVPIRMVFSSGDVIHNFNVKSYALSADAVPGRLNHYVVTPKVTGLFLGWCSENCGVGHYSMPCSMEVISFPDWLDYFLDLNNNVENDY